MYSTLKNPVFVNGKVVGKVVNGIFVKVIKTNGMLQKPPAIALAVSSLDDMERAEADIIRITNQDTGLIYSVTLAHFRRHCFDLKRGGYEAQKALPLEYWDVSGGKVARQVQKNEQVRAAKKKDDDPLIRDLVDNTPPMQLTFDIFKRGRK